MQSEKWCAQGHLNYCRPFQQSYGFVLNGNAVIKYCDEKFNPAVLQKCTINEEVNKIGCKNLLRIKVQIRNNYLTREPLFLKEHSTLQESNLTIISADQKAILNFCSHPYSEGVYSLYFFETYKHCCLFGQHADLGLVLW